MSFRQQIRFCTARDGVRIAYALSGKGPAIVKVGNWLTHLEYEAGGPVWGHLLEMLSSRQTLVRYDQRGTGLSDWDVASMTLDDWVSDLECVVDAAGIERFSLIALSQGTTIAAAYAVRHPERVTSLVIHGGYARGRQKRGSDSHTREEAETMVKLMELGWGRNDAAFRQFFTSQFIPRGSSEQHQWFNELQRISTSPTNAARMFREIDQLDVTPLLSRITCPTLVSHATRDLRVPFAEGRLIAGMIEQARFVPIDSDNHLMLLDDPMWPRWVEEVQEFLGHLPDAASDVTRDLTRRERQLLELLAQGRDNAQIAASLALSEKTVRNHITSIFAKLEVENRSQAIVLARNSGFGLDL